MRGGEALRQLNHPNELALGLTGREILDILGLSDDIKSRQELTVKATKKGGAVIMFNVIARLDTPVDVDYHKNGGILPAVLRKLVRDA